jgi:hypothetical protein
MSRVMAGPFRDVLRVVAAWREGRRSREAQAICPVDSWAFRPAYTEGHCPICGWEPPGAVVRLPLSRRVGGFGWMVIMLGALSVLMLVLVVAMYVRS